MNKYLIEAIGTFFLFLTIGLTAIGPSNGIAAPLAIGSILMAMIYAGAHISGAHYNPAASLGIWMRQRLTTQDLLSYIAFQIAGTLLATYIIKYLKAGILITPAGFAAGPSMLVEFLFTFALVFVVLNVATSRATEGNSYYGLAIGFTVTAGAFAVGSISGAAFSPAVTLGLALLGLIPWANLWVYIVAQFLGGAAAALTFNYLNPNDR